MYKILISIFIISSFHGGRTDSSGGHRDNINGGYHYHHGCAAHSHSGGCRYDYKDCERNYSYSDYSNDEDGFDFWSFLIISWLVIIVGSFIYDSITTVTTRKREKKEEINNEKQRIVEEEKRIKENRTKKFDSIRKSKNELSLKIKDLIRDFNNTDDKKHKFLTAISIAKSSYNAKKYTDTIYWSEEAQKSIPKLPLSYNVKDFYSLLEYRGLAYIQLGEYLNSIKVFKRVLKVGKSVSNKIYILNAYANIGICKLMLNQHNEALEDLNSAINTNIATAITFFYRAKVKYIISDKESDYGLDDINKSIDLNPKFLKSYSLKAKIKLKKESYYSAISVINDGLKIDKDDLYLTYLRGFYSYKNNDYNSAFKDFNKVIKFKNTSQASYKLKENQYQGYAHYYRSKIYQFVWTKLENRKSLNRIKLRNEDLKEAIKYNNKKAINKWMKISGD